MKASRSSIIIYTGIVCLIGGAGCFRKPNQYIPSPPQPAVISVPANTEGANASTGGIQATVTPSLESEMLVKILPSDNFLKGFTASIPEEKKNPVPMQDGTRTEFSTITKSFSKTAYNQVITIQASLTDTRSIPVLTAFLDSFSEYANERGTRKKIMVQGETAWLTYQKNSGDDSVGFGSITMLYRNRFLIQIDGNLGVTQDELVQVLNGYDFSELK